jgi:hypothetical protein
MLGMLVTVLATAVNVTVAFMTDGQWKTAGLSIAQLYWRTGLSRLHDC